MSAAEHRARRGARRSAAAPPRTPSVVQGGGPNVGAVDDALALLAAAAATPRRADVGRGEPRASASTSATRRIGLAVTDPSGTLASPHAMLERSGDAADDHRAIVAAARRGGRHAHRGRPAPVAVGQARARGARRCSTRSRRCTELARADGIEVDTYDERFTTVIAERNLRDANPRRSKRQRAQRERIDAAAAAVILQSWLEAARE